MMAVPRLLVVAIAVASAIQPAAAGDFAYLDEFCDPYYVGRDFPKLVTPQWVGEKGVDAVVVLSIDDMRGHEKWEAYLRPIIDRMKKSQGRAAISIMTCSIDPDQPHLQTWLKEGLSIEVHTIDHPCPCLQGSDFDRAAKTYHDCVDLMNQIAGNAPVAFRMPCCDSRNTPSPRFWAEIFNSTSTEGKFLQIDSSVFNITTPEDQSLPRDLVLDKDGKPRFRRYLPFPSFVNTIEDYPYPYVIGRLCWQFPCVVPSDWEAQNIQRPNNPATVADMQRALDAAVLKQGVFALVFHPHGWIRNDQIVELVDYAEKKYGRRVKFLNFRDCAERLNKNLLAGQPLRNPVDGDDNGVRLLDVNNDGFLDVVIGNPQKQLTRVWLPKEHQWRKTAFPVPLVHRADGKVIDTGVRFDVLRDDGYASFMVQSEKQTGGWHFDEEEWTRDDKLLAGLTIDEEPLRTSVRGVDQGVRLRDLNGDGRCELIAGGPQQRGVFRWDEENRTWRKAPFSLPEGVAIVDEHGNDAGARFVDINGDKLTDIVFSNEKRWSAHLLTSLEKGWTQSAAGEQAADGAVPPIVRGTTNNGAWFHSDHLWVQNEDTHNLPDGVARLALKKLVEKIQDAGGELPPPKSPEESLQSIKVRPGLKIELVAAEPLVVDPVAFDWGPDGRLWVVEMRDYPDGLDGKGKTGGRVTVLTDTNDDGRYDEAKVFLDELPFPTGVKLWREGILVTAAPKIIYAEDTDDDGRADVTRTLYEGFGEGNQQHRVNGLRWGLDNWLYVGNGDSGGQIRSTKTGESVDVRNRDLRIRPDTGDLQAISGNTQYGINRDDWGNWFGGNNSHPAWHYVLDDVYLRRNPHFAPPAVKREISVAPGAARVFPLSRTLARFNDFHTANHFTSACSPMIYRDRALGGEYYGNIFVCEPVHNLVHREIVSPSGATFTSGRAEDERESEFLASTDNWFRPAMIRTGPDGALWVADMYRLVIEHPKWIPEDWQRKLNLRAGDDRGRIYRISPADGGWPRVPRLDRLDRVELVAQVESTSGPVRDLAQQMLIWRGDAAAVAPLEKMVSQGKSPQARLHALCTLDGLERLSEASIRNALDDDHPAVRRHAVRLGETLAVNEPELVEAMVALAGDDDPLVRMQLAYSAGNWPGGKASAQALARLLIRAQRDHDELLRAAAMSSLNADNVGPILAALLDYAKDDASSLAATILAQAVALGASETILPAVEQLSHPHSDGEYAAEQLNAAASAFAALNDRNDLRDVRQAVETKLKPLLEFAQQQLQAADSTPDMKIAAMTVLRHAGAVHRPDAAALLALLDARQPPAVQSAALASLSARNEEPAMRQALAAWRRYTPSVRGQLIGELLSREAHTTLLLDAIKTKAIARSNLSPQHRRQLLEHPQQTIRRRAEVLLGGEQVSSREAVLKRFAAVAKQPGDAAAGRTVFAKRCAACHRLNGEGNDVGADLTTLTNRAPEALLVAILDPNRAVEDKFLNYTAVLRDGRVLAGMLQSEAGESLTLRNAEGQSVTLLRKDIDELVSSGTSFMPEGLEADLTEQQLADVIAYVGVSRAKPRTFAGNQPAIVRVGDDGILHLPATAARIYGSRMVFEPQYKNLGWWQNDDDHAAWDVEVPAAGIYNVEIDFACHQSAAGNRWAMSLGGSELSGKVPSTGTWDDYQWLKVGKVKLQRGRSEVVMRPDGMIRGALIDLREIRLSPAGD